MEVVDGGRSCRINKRQRWRCGYIFLSIVSSTNIGHCTTQLTMHNQKEVKREQERPKLPAVIPLPPAPKKDINKFICPLHLQSYRFRCTNPACGSPYVCHIPECLEEHFHSASNLVLAKFNPNIFKTALQTAEKAKEKIEQHYSKAMLIKSQLDSVRSSMGELMVDFKKVNSLCEIIHQQLDHTLTRSFMGTLDSVVNAELKIKSSIEELKKTIFLPASEEREREDQRHLEDTSTSHPLQNGIAPNQEKTVSHCEERREVATLTSERLGTFLQANLPNYKESTLKVLFEGILQQKSLGELHSDLQGKSNLVILISGYSLVDEKYTVIGCYFSTPYPNSSLPKLRDPFSFIFFSDPESSSGFSKFLSNPDCADHLWISDTSLEVGGGGLVLNGPGSTVDCSLPTDSYLGERKNIVFSHTVKIDRIRILQLDFELD